jgi:hypothetical protein
MKNEDDTAKGMPMSNEAPVCLRSIVLRIDPIWRCPCGRTLKAWDFIFEDTELQHITCSRCHRRLLTIDRE